MNMNQKAHMLTMLLLIMMIQRDNKPVFNAINNILPKMKFTIETRIRKLSRLSRSKTNTPQ